MKRLSCLMRLVILLSLSSNLYGWENELTHPAITDKAVGESIIDDYLKTQLDLTNGISAELEWDFPTNIKKRMGKAEPDKTTRSALEWLQAGSTIEDDDGRWPVPWRPRHHFYDPTRNAGLDNHTDHPDWTAPGTSSWLPLGQSALVWAIDGTASQEPTTNNETWEDARVDFYLSLIMPEKADREEQLAITFLDLGCVLHMLEDMGVPAHTRNDFLFGHYRTFYDNGNPLETWAEEQVEANGGQSLWSGSNPIVFDKLAKYFDTDVYSSSYLGDGVLPPDTWGLSECSNYQFLSLSTMFGCSGSKYQFAHPAKENMGATIVEGPKRYFNGANYGVSHMARESYTYYKIVNGGYMVPPQIVDMVDSTNTTDDGKVFEDYAQITMPRTIDYAAGLANYFFRGRLSIEQNYLDHNTIELTITNKSINTTVEQILKGGVFKLYWDDDAGNRTQINDFEVENGWNSASTLVYDDTVTGTFTVPNGQDPNSYTLIYKGSICENPANLDSDDSEAIAVATQKAIRSPIYVYVAGNRDLRAQKDKFTPANVEVGDTFILTVIEGEDEVEISFTADEATVANVTAGLTEEWNSSVSPLCASITAADATTYLTLQSDLQGGSFTVEPSTTNGGGGTDNQTLTRAVVSVARKGNVWKFLEGKSSKLWEYDTGSATIRGIAVDDDCIYVVGNRWEDPDDEDVFYNVWKISLEGELIWKSSTSSNGTAGASDVLGTAYGIALGANGKIYVATQRRRDISGTDCYSVWEMNDDGDLIDKYDTEYSAYDIVLDSTHIYTVSGAYSQLPYYPYTKSMRGWVHKITIGSSATLIYYTSVNWLTDIAIDSNGDLCACGPDVMGYFAGTTVKLDNTGNMIWLKNQEGQDIAFDIDNDIYIASITWFGRPRTYKLSGETGNQIWTSYVPQGYCSAIAMDTTKYSYVGLQPDSTTFLTEKPPNYPGHAIWGGTGYVKIYAVAVEKQFNTLPFD